MNQTLRFPRGLYGVTPDWADTDRLLHAIREAYAGGMAVLQWRRKTGALAGRLEQARAVRALCRTLGLPLIINDDWRLALELDAEGAHLGRDDGSVSQARQALGPGKFLGSSCYDDLALATRQLQNDVDYVAFGAMYPSHTKPGEIRASVAHLRAAREQVQGRAPRPAIVAIGGITPDNAPPLIEAGADSVAVVSALFEAADVRTAARQFANLFV